MICAKKDDMDQSSIVNCSKYRITENLRANLMAVSIIASFKINGDSMRRVEAFSIYFTFSLCYFLTDIFYQYWAI